MIDHIVLADGTRRTDIARNELLAEFEVRSTLAVKFWFESQYTFKLMVVGILYPQLLVCSMELAYSRGWYSRGK
jgi:hypothetical protein